MTWAVVGALAAVCVAMRVAIPLGIGDRRPERLDRALEAATPALLAALVVTGAVGGDAARVPGVLAGAAVVALRKPMLLVLVVAAGVTAAIRAL